MAKDPAVLFYTSDFLSGTALMSNEQVGKYIKLLCLQHQLGKLREKDMINICGTYDEDIFKKFTKDDNGFYVNERLNTEVERRKAYSASRKKNRESKKICKTYDDTYVPHMETETETILNNKGLSNKTNNGEKDFSKLPKEGALIPLADCLGFYLNSPTFSMARDANCIRSGILPPELTEWAKKFNESQNAKAVLGMTLKSWAEYFGNWLNKQNTHKQDNNGKREMVF